MPSEESQTGLSPHPVLKKYYADEPSRKKCVAQLFDSAAPHYDWINRVMSFGTGERYRLEALQRAGLRVGQRVLDVGCGTGVLALHQQRIVTDKSLVLGIDPSTEMIRLAAKSGVKRTVQGRGELLPLKTKSFDFVSMGYALRHVETLDQAFTEYRRILVPGGTLLLLELGPPPSRIGFHLAKLYLKRLVPLVTRIGTRSRDAQELMSYYWDTVHQCVPPESILSALESAGFVNVERRVLHGILSEYVARRPVESSAYPAGSHKSTGQTPDLPLG